MQCRTFVAALLGLAVVIACQRAQHAEPTPAAEHRTPPASTATQARQVFVDTVPVPGDQPVFVLRGVDPSLKAVGVFLHGWCGHGLGYLQAFQFAAARAGRFVAVQGDVRCGNNGLRGWSGDVDALDRRVDAALRVAVGEVPSEILVAGVSQGVDRAVDLARRFPRKYTRLVLTSGPRVYSPFGLRGVVGAYFLVGRNENVWPTRATFERWRMAGIHSAFFVIEGAGHADFGGRGDALMDQAFRFLGTSVTPEARGTM